MEEKEQTTDEVKDKTVLRHGFSGGPHGLGDPDDRRLRKVEEEIMVPKVMRRIAQLEVCVDQMKLFNDCYLDHPFLFSFKCKEQNNVMKDCLIGAFSNEQFRNKCTEIYLAERAEYRRTGLQKKHMEFLKQREEARARGEDKEIPL